jgi:trehalose synthase
MAYVEEVSLPPLSFDGFGDLIGEEKTRQVLSLAVTTKQRLEGRTWWHINSTSAGGGVAEMLHSLLAYARGLGIETRWLTVGGTPPFFKVTKRLHHALHGAPGDGSPLGPAERAIYEEVLEANARELTQRIRPGDVVLLHDPQSAGLAPALLRHGATVMWRCHVGADTRNAHTDIGWELIGPYLDDVSATIFSRERYVPAAVDPRRAVVIAPSIDPFSPKNQFLDEATVRSILVHTGLLEGPAGDAEPLFRRENGASGRVTRPADIVRSAGAPTWTTPLVVQVSRWDPLKDPAGVMQGFAALFEGPDPIDADLALVGPDVSAVTDDPEGAVVLDSVRDAWRELPERVRRRIHLVSLPMTDREENAAVVNAIQRHATVVVQKSLQEGFGLTVTEAMWKGRPVVASAAGGVQDQIDDGVHGLLLEDPTDLKAYGQAVRRVLEDRELAARLGDRAAERVHSEFLGVRALIQYAELFERIDEAGSDTTASASVRTVAEVTGR